MIIVLSFCQYRTVVKVQLFLFDNMNIEHIIQFQSLLILIISFTHNVSLQFKITFRCHHVYITITRFYLNHQTSFNYYHQTCTRRLKIYLFCFVLLIMDAFCSFFQIPPTISVLRIFHYCCFINPYQILLYTVHTALSRSFSRSLFSWFIDSKIIYQVILCSPCMSGSLNSFGYQAISDVKNIYQYYYKTLNFYGKLTMLCSIVVRFLNYTCTQSYYIKIIIV